MEPKPTHSAPKPPSANHRLRLWYGVLVIILLVFITRLFYLQIIKHDFYKQQALSDQTREYSIAAERGVIEAHSGSAVVPLVLNQKLYTLFADPALIKDPQSAAKQVAAITKGNASAYQKAMTAANSRYQVLERRLNRALSQRVLDLKLPGVATQAVNYRLYPQGNLAAQTLGYVDNDGAGKYGVEQYFNQQLAGTPGRLKAITDVNGIPLAASKDNVEIDPKAGDKLLLTIDVAIQKQLEDILRRGLARAASPSGSAVILDPYSGAVKAMANWPAFDPSKYFETSDPARFANPAVGSPFEIGSVMKVLTMAAALDLRVVNPNGSYYDPGHWKLDGHDVTNVEEVNAIGRRKVLDILQSSLNTGATWLLMQMGGGQINQQARERWHNYMVNHYQFGKPTGIEQGYESGGMVPDPKQGFALDLTFANTSFGQAMTATPLQMAAALASVVNGGTYFKPYLVESRTSANGQKYQSAPAVVRKNVVSAKTAKTIRQMMEYMVRHRVFSPPLPSNYGIGGKTGTPQIANPAGGYYTDRFNGSYLGYVGGDKPQYVVAVRVNEPKVGTYAGIGAAQPLFGDIAHMLIDNFGVAPKGR